MNPVLKRQASRFKRSRDVNLLKLPGVSFIVSYWRVSYWPDQHSFIKTIECTDEAQYDLVIAHLTEAGMSYETHVEGVS